MCDVLHHTWLLIEQRAGNLSFVRCSLVVMLLSGYHWELSLFLRMHPRFFLLVSLSFPTSMDNKYRIPTSRQIIIIVQWLIVFAFLYAADAWTWGLVDRCSGVEDTVVGFLVGVLLLRKSTLKGEEEEEDSGDEDDGLLRKWWIA